MKITKGDLANDCADVRVEAELELTKRFVD